MRHFPTLRVFGLIWPQVEAQIWPNVGKTHNILLLRVVDYKRARILLL